MAARAINPHDKTAGLKLANDWLDQAEKSKTEHVTYADFGTE
jgi:hypothetical protein